MRVLLLAALLGSALLAATPKITYTKSFPGSSPEYLCLTVDQAGALEYKEAPDEKSPLQAHLQTADTAALFDMAEKLNYFKGPIESGLKVANTGKKTFRYQDASGTATETAFNYSTDETAQHLLDKLEQIAASERAYLDLERTVRYDKLGVNDSLATIESLWLRKELAAPEQFNPLLTRIATHEAFMHLVRDRASRLKEQFAAAAGIPPTVDAKSK
jgi:hypothetical protein